MENVFRIMEVLEISAMEAAKVEKLFNELKSSEELFFQEMELEDFLEWAKSYLSSTRKEPEFKMTVTLEWSFYNGDDAVGSIINLEV